MIQLIIFILSLLLCGCSSNDDANPPQARLRYQKGEYIYRKHHESLFATHAPEHIPPKTYRWHIGAIGSNPKITKEYFRCKGSALNPCHVLQEGRETKHIYDCGGPENHSLPLRDGKEFVYPILLELVNYIQNKTGKHVVITCGHRCPEHNTYADPSPESLYSKHMIGAEVSFYVKGMEDQPEAIVKILQNFYKENARYRRQKDYEDFKRYEKEDTNVSNQPWFNKEIFIKLFNKNEGRNLDNRHPFPYLSIQVRYDRDINEKVIYTWTKANRNYHRW